MDHAGRRLRLRQTAPQGDILILSASYVPRNYPAEIYPFHQDATFRYFTGLKEPDAALLIKDDGTEILFVTEPDPDDVIWTGPVPGADALAAQAGIRNTANYADLGKYLTAHTLWIEPYDFRLKLRLAAWLSITPDQLSARASRELGRAIIELRAHKDPDEIAELNEAITLTKRMISSAQAVLEPGRLESDILAALLAPAIANERDQAFNPIVTVHGETLHNSGYSHRIEPDDMLVIDCGAESPEGYCADITRTLPASGIFSAKKQILYDAVLAAQHAGIEQTKVPGTTQYEVHIAACRALTEALKHLGLMRGNVDDAVSCGAHALFMPQLSCGNTLVLSCPLRGQ